MINALTLPEFIDSTPLLNDPEKLRARGRAEGYLFFRALLPRQEVLRVRSDLLGVMRRHGWLRAGQDALGGRLNLAAIQRIPDEQMRADIGVSIAGYDEAQKLASLHRLPHHQRLIALYRTLFEREVLVHPRHIARMITPHRTVSPTPAHQDFPLIQGTTNTWTCWAPMGDCPRTMGSLIVLRGSHRKGYIPIEPARGAGGIGVQLCPGESDWVGSDFQAGDVLTFTSHTVHRALPNQFKDRVRLSLDVRYQPVDEVVEQKSLLPHCALAWEEIYKKWRKKDLQYYWRELPLTYSPFDTTLMQPSRRIC